MKIAILDDYQDVVRELACFSRLNGHDVVVFNDSPVDVDILAERLNDAEALVLIRERTSITEALLQRLPKLRLISQTGKVSQHIDPALCQKYGVTVVQGVGSPVAPSELCWALLMSAYRHIPGYVHQLKNGLWQHSGLGLGRVLSGKTLGIWGYGKIGQRIAQYAKAFDMSVTVWGSESSRLLAEQHGFYGATDKASFFKECDIISLHMRLNDATRYCVTANDLALMKDDALLVNISRAELIEPGALYRDLKMHPTKIAAIDVFEAEPVSAENEPLLALPNVVATPHIGYVEQCSYELYFNAAFANVVAFAQGRPKNVVDV